MSESLRTTVEIGFNVLYLIVVWAMVYPDDAPPA